MKDSNNAIGPLNLFNTSQSDENNTVAADIAHVTLSGAWPRAPFLGASFFGGAKTGPRGTATSATKHPAKTVHHPATYCVDFDEMRSTILRLANIISLELSCQCLTAYSCQNGRLSLKRRKKRIQRRAKQKMLFQLATGSFFGFPYINVCKTRVRVNIMAWRDISCSIFDGDDLFF